ncbi:hypothetical protein [Halomarina oriensis]|uniref:Uncharacterized protein n=1 Tax=Halomarina oriensis TaxID=671145 RepID=A0A6B0GSF3_9EURY|nr:hypothetical protein [Halomarina oriensis]MWG36247.1 hypothetical protein [Halomarina oriensis]
MVAQNIAYLREHGPSPIAELPGRQIRPADRKADIRRFTLTVSGGTRIGGSCSTVAYLAAHDRKAVLRTFLEDNPGVIANRRFRDFQKLLSEMNREWKAPSREIRDEFFDKPDEKDADGHPQPSEQECPHCGDAVSFGEIPNHIRNGCEAFAEV